MQKNRKSLSAFLAAALALAAAALFLAACDVDSVDSVTATPSDNSGTIYNYSGLYARAVTNGLGPLVFPANGQSGTVLTWLRLIQYGNVLEGYDNAGLTWSGNISAQNGGAASFNLNGRTTAGNSVSIAGTLSTETVGSSTNGSATVSGATSTMDATWIEPSFSGSIIASATISPPVTAPALKISPASASLSTNNATVQFSASGGSGTYNWSVSETSKGNISPTSGNLTTYTATHVAGNNTVTLTDSAGRSVTALVTYTATGSTNSTPATLKISPTSLTFNNAAYEGTFTATGGTGSYRWNVGDTNLGTLATTTGASVIYTSKKVSGTNTITVIDSDNARASAAAIF